MAINKVFLLGNLGKDPELRMTTSQTPVGSFSLATSDRRKDPSGNWVEHTEWHNIVVFGKTAENCAQYLKKGRQAFIEGRIQTRKWQDKEGRDRYTTEIVASTVQFVGGAKGAPAGSGDEGQFPGMSSGGGTAQFDAGLSSPAPVAMPSGLKPADAVASAGPAAFDDDDIPF